MSVYFFLIIFFIILLLIIDLNIEWSHNEHRVCICVYCRGCSSDNRSALLCHAELTQTECTHRHCHPALCIWRRRSFSLCLKKRLIQCVWFFTLLLPGKYERGNYSDGVERQSDVENKFVEGHKAQHCERIHFTQDDNKEIHLYTVFLWDYVKDLRQSSGCCKKGTK